LSRLKDCHDEIDFQGDFVDELVKESDYGHCLDVTAIFHSWEHDKDDNILTYRDKSFASIFTGTKSPIHHTTFMEALDDSLECYLNVKK
jgi:trimethylamine monooxygenase